MDHCSGFFQLPRKSFGFNSPFPGSEPQSAVYILIFMQWHLYMDTECPLPDNR